MRALSAAELLDVWERGQGQLLPQQALLLLSAASPDIPADRLGELSIGQRDARLLTLREWTFGSQWVSLAACPACHEQLERTLTTADILPPGLEAEEGEVDAGPLSLSVGGYQVQFRLPNSQDLVAVAECGDVAAGRRLLLERCLLAARRGDESISASELPADVVEALTARMAEADPLSDLRPHWDCPLCGHQWQASLDVASFFWKELSAWAERTLYQVHGLARAYGWREADVLALSPWRRQYYLDLACRA